MYVCVCNAVTESQVLRAAEEGVRNLRGLQARLGIALECGRCAGHAHGLLRGKTRTNKPQCSGNCGACPNAKEKKS
ncbi:MAG: (2Fe-2S)-binding protein [Denitratisoma sp.]|nr:(2Fe-2S)-binding protein [Denitratisoma sp.]